MRASIKKFLYTGPDVEADLIKHAHRLRSWIDGLEDDPALVDIDYIANLMKQASKVSGMASTIYVQAERLYREYAAEERDE